MSIPEITNKIKYLSNTKRGRDILSILVLICMSTGSFMLGRESKLYNTNTNIAIVGALDQKQGPEVAFPTGSLNKSATPSAEIYEKGNYLASKRGKKYYPVDCPAANNIKVENRLYFKTATEAESKGYSLSSSCN